jgi:acyl dehydratase
MTAIVTPTSPSHSTRSFASIALGDTLPPVEVPLTRKLIIGAAIASRDYQDVHHDPVLAKERGSPDIFMNILTTNGFVGRFVTDWTGPETILRKVDIRLGAPNYPDDTMILEGSVTAKNESESTVEVSLRGRNGIGDHVTGKVIVAFPCN